MQRTEIRSAQAHHQQAADHKVLKNLGSFPFSRAKKNTMSRTKAGFEPCN